MFVTSKITISVQAVNVDDKRPNSISRHSLHTIYFTIEKVFISYKIEFKMIIWWFWYLFFKYLSSIYRFIHFLWNRFSGPKIPIWRKSEIRDKLVNISRRVKISTYSDSEEQFYSHNNVFITCLSHRKSQFQFKLWIWMTKDLTRFFTFVALFFFTLEKLFISYKIEFKMVIWWF